MFELKMVNEIVQIAASGGGFRLKASLRPTHELVQIAAAASGSGARITFTGLNLRTTAEIVQIAAAGNGCVSFEDKD